MENPFIYAVNKASHHYFEMRFLCAIRLMQVKCIKMKAEKRNVPNGNFEWRMFQETGTDRNEMSVKNIKEENEAKKLKKSVTIDT